MGAYLRKDKPGIAHDLEEMYQLFPILRERVKQYAGTLSGGEQQMLAIARGLMGRPRLLLLDEPSLGLAPLMVQHMFKTIREINQRGVTVLLAEQNAFQALDMADRAFVLETGQVIVSGSGQELLENPLVQKAYLGVTH
jgi:branched-chain amino acid transport system ATP-binding protein